MRAVFMGISTRLACGALLPIAFALTLGGALADGPPGPGWQLRFRDEFNQKSLDDNSATQLVMTGNGVANGTIKLRMGSELPHANNRISNLASDRSFGQQYGWFEARAKMAPGAGIASTFWILPLDGRYARLKIDGGTRASPLHAFEIDIFEMLGRNPFGNLFTAHAGGNDGLDPARRVSDSTAVQFPKMDLTAGFHTYALHWTPKLTTWLVDGKPVARSELVAHSPFYVLAVMYEGDGWIGPKDPNLPYPVDYEIDYVRVYGNSESITVRLVDEEVLLR
jgi:beta-glucanase (GH16 family)